MPMQLTKKSRLSWAFGVYSSTCPRCARSNERIVDCILMILPEEALGPLSIDLRGSAPKGGPYGLQGDGVQRLSSGSFLKCGLVTHVIVRLTGSSTIVVIANHSLVPSVKRSKY